VFVLAVSMVNVMPWVLSPTFLAGLLGCAYAFLVTTSLMTDVVSTFFQIHSWVKKRYVQVKSEAIKKF
jgi:hypothetical protein